MALRLIACVLLLEITSFLRETYKSLPKTQRSFFPGAGTSGSHGGAGRVGIVIITTMTLTTILSQQYDGDNNDAK